MWRLCAGVAFLVVASTQAQAQNQPAQEPEHSRPAPEPERPWARGVAPGDQQTALALFETGNKQFVDESYVEARTTYERALAKWDHPSIRYNLSECLIHLDRPVLAYEHLQMSLTFGAAPLGERVYRRALTRQKLLESSLARVEVSGDQSGARFSLDGEELFVGPGSRTVVVKPGRHLLVVEKEGFSTLSDRIVAIPGEPYKARIQLAPVVADGVELRRRWSAWMPWMVVGAGAAVGLAGGGLLLKGESDLGDFDDAVVETCPGGCLDDAIPELLDDRDRANRYRLAGGVLLGVGAAVAVTGSVLVIFNQPKKITTGKSVQVSGLLVPGSAGMTISGRF
ncbi:MAG: PEGA domain-containing protein [Deltaproteobacteria bacterium]|nr:PEGA domain-containing protein [Deltaproteobacteria bacterium]